MLLLPLALFIVHAAALPAEQKPLQLIAADTAPDLSAELFRSLQGFLKSWSQAFQPIGRTAVPSIIPAGTLLYHGRKDSHPPTSGLDWFALDAEHAYMFASRGFDSTFNTYVATRPLKVLYFDGFSASKGNPGSLDLQKLIAFGIEEQPGHSMDPDRSPPRFEDGRIAAGLCEWGASHGIQGFVREEATFELVWCDFSQGVKLLRSVNTTRSDWNEHGPPGHPPPGAPPKVWTKGLPGPLDALPSSKENHRDFPGRNSIRQWQMLNAASWHYFSRDSRVHLNPQYLTTLTDAAYTSLRPIYDLPVQDRRINGISHEDFAVFKQQLEFNIQAWHTADGFQSKADYLSIVDVIVDRTAGRLNRVKSAFKLSNSTEAVNKVKNEVLDILFPFVDVPRVLWEGKDRPDARTRYAALRQATKSCSTMYTSYLADETATSTERLILSSFEGVLSRICDVAAHILSDSLGMQVRTMSEGMRARYESKILALWQEKVEALISWLDWPVWKTCEHACADDEICYMPMWPIGLSEGRREGPGGPGISDEPVPIQSPRCVKRS